MDIIRAKYINDWLKKLPQGNISYKTINGKKYPYYQWMENGKQKSRTVKVDELEELTNLIEKRKILKKQLKESYIPDNLLKEDSFSHNILYGNSLYSLVQNVITFERRECYQLLHNYLYSESDRLLILYGLRRTGKTTLMKQAILNMDDEDFLKTAFIQINTYSNLDTLYLDLKNLQQLGFKYIFIDEITMMQDFIETASYLSDIFTSSGMKIVLSGTDSLGFMFSIDRQLYDRTILIHTTYIPYREFRNILQIKGIDEYISFGGTMSKSGINYNHELMIFNNKESTNEYIDSAIAKNIQHSLKNYENGNHFRTLKKLYEQDELTNAINRIVEDINHRFTIDVLTKDFISNDFSLAKHNLIKDKIKPNDILYKVNREQIEERLKDILEIKNKQEQKIPISSYHITEIKEYLEILDIIMNIDIVSLTNLNQKEQKTIITQPGLRYAQAKALIESLLKDEVFSLLPLTERNEIEQRILSDIKGRMMEDIVLLETKMKYPNCEVFKLQFAIGEFDMVVFNPLNASCDIYEVKYSSEINSNQYRHLIDKEKCEKTSFRYGPIQTKNIIYRGPSKQVDEINYINVEEYLMFSTNQLTKN